MNNDKSQLWPAPEMTADRRWSGRRVLVTGGAGFIGSALTRALVDLGCEVTVLDDLSFGRRRNLVSVLDRVELVRGCIRDTDLCADLCRDRSIVFHLAALGSVPRSLVHPARYVEVNVGGTACLFEACRDQGVKSVVFASSSSVYGDSSKAVRREGEEGRVISPYAFSKRTTEEMAELFAHCYGMKFVALRYFNIYGPRQRADSQYAAVIPRFLEAALTGAALEIYGNGLQTRDFTFVSDAVRVTLGAADAEQKEGALIMNVGAGGATTVLDLARSVLELTGSASEIVHLPPRDGDVHRATADLCRSREVLGFAPRFDIAAGLRATLDSIQPADHDMKPVV